MWLEQDIDFTWTVFPSGQSSILIYWHTIGKLYLYVTTETSGTQPSWRSCDKTGSQGGSKGGYRPQLGTYFVPGSKAKGIKVI